ncbi:putative CoA-transferase alpha subunit [Oscillibacter valericigenes Sjm18-20]|nr:putative CoA-transferase alpha subunit [Oscillibacter valericigenes Sjm18-20]
MSNKPLITAKQAAERIPDGAILMIGGVLGCGQAHSIISELKNSDKKNFTLIGNDMGRETGPAGESYYGVSALIHNRQVRRVIATHVGMSPEVGQQSNEGFLEVDLVPQGSLAEMIRAGGAGLGGVLTPVGVGTIVESSPLVNRKLTIDGKDYLLMKAIHADVALLGGYEADLMGNIWYKGTMRNFNVPMATAADLVIAETEHLVEVGTIKPENVMTPGILVDYIVKGENG